MSVRIVPARSGKGWEYDIRFTWPEGGRLRERGKCPVGGKDASRRWAEQRERVIAAAGKAAYTPLSVKSEPSPTFTALTFAELWPRVVSDHYRANRKKPSTIEAAESIYKNHLAGLLGAKAITDIRAPEIAALKGRLADVAPKTVNNVLTVLSRALRCAVEWGELTTMPKIGFLKVPPGAPQWYELHEYRRLVESAGKCGSHVLVLTLLAGSAGLRRGEIMALKWSDLDLARRLIHVQRQIWRGHEGSPKGGRARFVPMTPELHDALNAHRHLKGERVLYTERGEELGNRTVRNWLAAAQRRAGLEVTAATVGDKKAVAPKTPRKKDRGGAIHMLRHTFCSHLALAGAPAKAIQELAGHTDLVTTQRYMHLSPANRSEAMATLARFYAGAEEERSRAIG
jgi:integrase